MGWKFKNRLFEFGAAWLVDIDRMVARNCQAAEILRWLKDHYNGPLPIPDQKTIRTYVKWKRQTMRLTAGSAIRIRKETERTDTELREMLGRLQIADMDLSNPKAAYEKIIRFLFVRTEITAQVQDNLMDPRFEQVITGHLALAKNTLDSIQKMDGQLGTHGFIARRIVEKFISELAPIIKQAAEDTWGPDKVKAFLEKVNKGSARIDFSKIKREATIEAAAYGTEEVLDAITATRSIPS
jgi:hypothetical protein